MKQRISNPIKFRVIQILLAALLAFAVGCASDDQPVEERDESGVDSEFSDASGAAAGSGSDMAASAAAGGDVDLPNIYFDFDRYDIRDEYKAPLRVAADGLQGSGATIVIEGHTDERGSEEYNLALGERRAGAVRKYLYNLGVPMGQMTTVSYGESRPAVAGSGESVWQLNRRAEFRAR